MLQYIQLKVNQIRKLIIKLIIYLIFITQSRDIMEEFYSITKKSSTNNCETRFRF